MPMRAELYPEDWSDIAHSIKEACDWRCLECNAECQRPGETFTKDKRSEATKRVLTVAHYFHDYISPEIYVVALCAPCHMIHDRSYHLRVRKANQRRYHIPFAFMQERNL
jgi:hypothetical protein